MWTSSAKFLGYLVGIQLLVNRQMVPKLQHMQCFEGLITPRAYQPAEGSLPAEGPHVWQLLVDQALQIVV